MAELLSQVITVSQFIEVLNETLGFAFPLVTVEGEVHSFKVNQGKWVFFDLKDDEATLGCFMPIFQLKVPLEDGMKVRVSGVPKLTKWGKFSFTAKSVELAGEGELRRAFELLKARLGAEGLFEPARKRVLPEYPRRIGLVASSQSAAYADFVKILAARWGGLDITLADVQVQGAPAPGQIMSALHYFDQLAHPVDVVVLIRGGGSLEDLQAFNTEDVARAVAGSRTPIMVGVGHEVDFSLADYAADVRAATPSDAARLVAPDRVSVLQLVEHTQTALARLMAEATMRPGQQVDRAIVQMSRFLAGPRELVAAQESLLRREYYRFELKFGSYQQHISSLSRELRDRQEQALWRHRQRLGSLARILHNLSPQANLQRGYAIVRHDNGVVKSARQVTSGDRLMIQLADGTLRSQVEETL